jgi:cellulose synthase/poly-beta-1,6-N-acetylglucosamine synthase-like glycosyltransferase
MIEIRGATGLFKITASALVFKTEENKNESTNFKLSPGFLTILIVTIVMMIAFGVVYLTRRHMARSRRSLSSSELEGIDNTNYTIIPQANEDDRLHFKKTD